MGKEKGNSFDSKQEGELDNVVRLIGTRGSKVDMRTEAKSMVVNSEMGLERRTWTMTKNIGPRLG